MSKNIDNLLKAFEYTKKYHVKIFVALLIILEAIIFKKLNKKIFLEIINKKRLKDESLKIYSEELAKLIDSPTKIDKNINIAKVLKLINSVDIDADTLADFIDKVTVEKSINNLYSYSTPKEIVNLLVELLDVKENESVYNSCFGLGSIFIALAKNGNKPKIYGEEIDKDLTNIAKNIAKIVDLDSSDLYNENLIDSDRFKVRNMFDKTICFPSLSTHIGIQKTKSDEALSLLGASKSDTEIAFISNLAHVTKKRSVLIVKDSILHKKSLLKARKKLIDMKALNTIIDLSDNILHNQKNKISIFILEENSKDLLLINASTNRFYKKMGKINRVVNYKDIVEIVERRENAESSYLLKYEDIDENDLRISNYKKKRVKESETLLEPFIKDIFRGQGIECNDKEGEKFHYMSINDFYDYGLTKEFGNVKMTIHTSKLKKYSLKSYDILIPMRSGTKVAIIGDIKESYIVPNNGIVVMRCISKKIAKAIYLYLRSEDGKMKLDEIYKNNLGKISLSELKSMIMPKTIEEDLDEKFEEVDKEAKKTFDIKEGIRKNIDSIFS